MDVMTLLTRMQANGYYTSIATNPLAQFGSRSRRLLGATVLPEQNVPENAYREEQVRYRSIIANDGTRYSPAQKKGGEITGSMLVELGNSDISRELSPRDYDALVRLVGSGEGGMEQMANVVLRFTDELLNGALIDANEKARWQAIINASVVRQGDNGYTETVAYPNPAGHRFNAGGLWSNDAYDPFDDILLAAEKLTDKGYSVSRIIATRNEISLLMKNAKFAQRAGRLSVTSGNDVVVQGGRVTLDDINNIMNANGLPAVEEYNALFNTSTGQGRFFPTGNMVFIASTGQAQEVPRTEAEAPLVLDDVLGYTAIGRATGQSEPGRAFYLQAFENKPPRVEGEGWQTSLPVIQWPDAISVIQSIA